MITDKDEMQRVMTEGVDTLLGTLGLTRDQVGGSNADILWTLCDRFREQDSIYASLTAMKLANTARDLEVQ